jgi:hypothetical protein
LRYLKHFTTCNIAAEGLDSAQFNDATIRRIKRPSPTFLAGSFRRMADASSGPAPGMSVDGMSAVAHELAKKRRVHLAGQAELIGLKMSGF